MMEGRLLLLVAALLLSAVAVHDVAASEARSHLRPRSDEKMASDEANPAEFDFDSEVWRDIEGSPIDASPLDVHEARHHRSLYSKNQEARLQEWWPLTLKVPTCIVGKAACSDGILGRLRYAVTAEAKMRHDGVLLGLGGYWVGWLGLVICAIGVWLGRDKEEKFGWGGRTSRRASTAGGDYSQVRKSSNLDGDFEDEDNASEDKFDSCTLGQGHEYRSASPLPGDSLPQSRCQTYKSNFVNYWTSTLSFTRPLTTFKIFIALLLVWELNGVMAPEQSMIATPELVALLRTLPKTHDYVLHWAHWAMPDLHDETADKWVWRLGMSRTILLLSWFGYMLSPPPTARALPSDTPTHTKIISHPWFSGTLYAIGAVIYVYLGCLGLMYNLAHSTQGGMLFILAAVPAVPYLNTDPRAGAWLRKMLYASVLVPIYLFSGVSKIRYEGIEWNLTGRWMWAAFNPNHESRAVLRGIFNWVHAHKWTMAIMSWGNLFLELFLPWIMIFKMDKSLKCRTLFHVTALFFHLTIFLLLGPNFARYVLMHLLASDPFSWFVPGGCCRRNATPAQSTQSSSSIAAPSGGQASKMDWLRIFISCYSILYWLKVQIHSDIDHLMGKAGPLERHNPYFPIPELSMFASPNIPTYSIALALCLISFFMYVYSMLRTQENDEGVVGRPSDQTVAVEDDDDVTALDLDEEEEDHDIAAGTERRLGTPQKFDGPWGPPPGNSPQSVMDVHKAYSDDPERNNSGTSRVINY